MSDPFPPENDGQDHVRFSVRIDVGDRSQLEVVAWFWNEIDRVKGKKRRHSWKPHSVLERFVRAQLDGFWTQLGASELPMAERKKHLERLIAKTAKEEAEKKSAVKKK